MRIALRQAGVLGGVEARIHAGQHGKSAGGWQRKIGFFSERCAVPLVGG
jgi:hypothetical protein